MPRFFCPDLSEVEAPQRLSHAPGPPPPLVVHLDPEESHHARRVLRLEVGDALTLFDGQGRWAQGVLAAWSGAGRGGQASIQIETIKSEPPPRPALDLAAAIPKGGHADEMIAGLSQLGVNQLIPLRTQHAVVDPRPAKIDRFNLAALESAKQCGRLYVMKVAAPAQLSEVMAGDYDLRLIAAPLQGEVIDNAASPTIAQRLHSAARVLILIGPEGGWSAEELANASAAGCTPWSLGPHVMRIETAAAAAAAIAVYCARA